METLEHVNLECENPRDAEYGMQEMRALLFSETAQQRLPLRRKDFPQRVKFQPKVDHRGVYNVVKFHQNRSSRSKVMIFGDFELLCGDVLIRIACSHLGQEDVERLRAIP